MEGGGVGEEGTSAHPHDPPPQVGGRTLRASNWAGGRWLPLATPGLLHSGRCGGGGGWWREVGWLEKGGHHHDPRDDPPGLDFKKNSPPPPNVHICFDQILICFPFCGLCTTFKLEHHLIPVLEISVLWFLVGTSYFKYR